jgi:hypothetical protein
VRTAALVLLALSLAACNRGTRSNEAVRQGIIDHLANKAGLNVKGMDINVTSVDFKGSDADATVSITPKGGNPAQGMSMKYHLQQQGNQWVVTGRQDAPGSPHGAGAMPGMENPHGGAGAPPTEAPKGGMAPPAGGGGKMPSPEDLPPVKKK